LINKYVLRSQVIKLFPLALAALPTSLKKIPEVDKIKKLVQSNRTIRKIVVVAILAIHHIMSL